MEGFELKSAIESMIFVAEEPVTEKHLVQLFAEDGIEKQQIKDALEK